MVWGSLLDGYDGEGSGIGWSLLEDASSAMAAGQIFRILKATKPAADMTRAEMASSNTTKMALQDINITGRISASGMENSQAGIFLNEKGMEK